MPVRAVDDAALPLVRGFLERWADTALFLLSNLEAHGPKLGDDLNSGNFKFIEEGGEIQAAFCLTRRGNLLAEAGGRSEFASHILDACESEPIQLGGLVGEWRLAAAMWQILQTRSGFVPTYTSQETLFRFDLPAHADEVALPDVRRLQPADFLQWDRLNEAYLQEVGLPMQATVAQRQAQFTRSADEQRWWGYFDDDRLLSTATLAVYKQIGTVGAVYTIPERRRQGMSRAVMNVLLADAVSVHRLSRLTLFTDNLPAQRLYESLGFRPIGSFALLFCSWEL